MKQQPLGRSGLHVAPIAFGGNVFNWTADEATSFKLLDAFVGAGFNLIDTADVYSRWAPGHQGGESEAVIGRWLASRPGMRERIVLATKVGMDMGEGRKGLRPEWIRQAVDDSLRRLQTDRIDLYQIHMQDITTPEEETVRALDDLVRAGKVVYLGASNYAAYRLADSLWIAKHEHRSRFISLQAQYSLIVRDLEREHIPLCQAHGLGLLPWSPLAAGFLSGKYRRGQAAPSGSRMEQMKARFARLDNERNWRILAVVDEVAKETGATPSQVALAWLLGRSTVSSIIFGARTAAQLDENLGAAALKLDNGHKKRLDEVSAIELGYPYNFMSDIQGRW